MMAVLLLAGIGFLLAGLLAIGYGIEINQFSFGNTLIIAGAVAASGGALMLALCLIVRELKFIARGLRTRPPAQLSAETALLATAANTTSRDPTAENGGVLFNRDQPGAESVGNVEQSSPPWQENALRGTNDTSSAPEPVGVPAVKPRRNLLFSTSSRKERERAEARAAGPSAAGATLAPAAPAPAEAREVPPATFDDAWPKSERARAVDVSPQRRGGRTPSTFAEPDAGATGADHYPPAERHENQLAVTVLKSGVVDGMAYSLYSDGSIEAQMPEGMMRFASIDELRTHLDQRP
jgi:hypothetical protein